METNGKPGHLSGRLLKASMGRCLRCGGLLIEQHYIDVQGEAGEVDYVALRCANCGEVVDHTILHNRSQPASPSLYGARPRKFAQRTAHQARDVAKADNRRRGPGTGKARG